MHNGCRGSPAPTRRREPRLKRRSHDVWSARGSVRWADPFTTGDRATVDLRSYEFDTVQPRASYGPRLTSSAFVCIRQPRLSSRSSTATARGGAMFSCRVFTVLTAVVVTLSLLAGRVTADRGAEVLGFFELPPLSLTNFGYSASQLDSAAQVGLIDKDKPAIGSGLAQLQGNWYLGITDRGPNIDHFPVN